MKIKKGDEERASGGIAGYHGEKRKGALPADAPRSPSFTQSLENAEIRELLARLDIIASRIGRFPAEGDLRLYRELVRELLRRAVGGLRIKRDMKWRRNDRNLFVTIEKTEAALEELEEIFSREGERTRVLQLMEEVKGCLISLLL
ncbi:MAG: DUF327 family protein [Aminivibrio sp.]